MKTPTTFTALLLTLFSLQGLQAFADDTPPAKPDHAAFEAAIEACKTEAGTDANGRPDHEKMDACMTKKGFQKPPGGGHGPGGPGGHRGPPPGPPPSGESNGSSTAE